MRKLLLLLLLYAAPASAQSFTVTAAPIPVPVANCIFQMDGTNTLPICSTTISAGAANPALSNLASVAINTALIPGTAGALTIGTATKPWGSLWFSGASATPGTNNFNITGTSTSGTRTLTLADGNTTLVAGTMMSTTSTSWAPTGGTATVTGILTGSSYAAFGGALNLVTTSTDGTVLQNTTAASAGVPVQISPRLRLRSQVWNTTAIAATNTNDFFLESVPVSGTTPSGLLKFGSSLDGAAATYPMTLSSAGTLTATTVLSGDGTAAAPAYSFASDTDTGIYSIAANKLGFATAGVAAITIDATGNVGIGTTEPSVALEISRNFALNDGIKLSDTDGGYFSVLNGTAGAGAYQPVFEGKGTGDVSSLIFKGLQTSGGTTYGVVKFLARNNADTGAIGATGKAFEFVNHTTTALSILGNGNVGIGTTTPTANTLQIVDAGTFGWSDIVLARAATQLNFTNAAATAGIGLNFATDAILKVRTRAQTGNASIEALNITATGSFVGMGAKLDAIQALASAAGCLSNNGADVFSYASCGTAATETAITDDTTTNAAMYPVWVTTNTGSLPLKVTSTKLSFNPSTGMLTSTGFTGPLTGLASSATILATTRAIYGNNFDGSAALTAVILPAYLNATVALTDGATPALDASLGHTFRLSTTTAPTIAVPSNPTSGQKIVIQFYASGAARTLALNTGTNGFRFGTDVTALSETASGKTDYIGAIWNATDSKWDVVAYAKGY